MLCRSSAVAICIQCCAFLLAVVVAGVRAADVNDVSEWYAFDGGKNFEPGVIGMADWLEKPAGGRGGVRMAEDRFQLEDGTPIKFWGVNLQYGDCMPAIELAGKMAARFAKYGVNAVRLHKIMEPGWAGFGDRNDSLKFDADKLGRFDNLTATLKEHGIYYGISWVFGHKIRPADKIKLIAYDEIMAAGGNSSRVLIFIAPDVQDLRINMLLNLLKHRNPHTGLTYAEDPANAFVEFQNEDSIFFYTFSGFNDLSKLPTYKKLFMKHFCEWLRGRYGSQEGLVKAWGEAALNAYEVKDEQLDKNNILPNGNPWLAGPDGLRQARENGTYRRVLDTARFFYETQLAYYKKFEKAVRDAGYRGPLVGSCWTTPAGLPLYYNLHTDYEVGFIDRHNYFGGMRGYAPRAGKFNNATMLADPGSGLLSSSFLQVMDRPFAFSEWSSVFPNEWALESVSIIAAYGMGLQGWDASYQFTASGRDSFWNVVAGNQNFVVDRVDQLGMYPTFARMIQRGDIQEGHAMGVRRVSLGELAEGGPESISLEQSSSEGDFKEMRAAYPSSAIAAGRVGVEFVEQPAAGTVPEMSRYVDENAVRSTTGQLAWTTTEAGRGWFTIDTAGTQAAVGFLPSKAIRLGSVTFEPQTAFCGLYLTSLDRRRGIKEAGSCLLSAMARVRNTGMVFNQEMTELLEVGRAPLLVEPVVADVTIAGRAIASVEVLDHDGRHTGRMLPAQEGRFRIDGRRDRTPYYLVTFR